MKDKYWERDEIEVVEGPISLKDWDLSLEKIEAMAVKHPMIEKAGVMYAAILEVPSTGREVH